MNRPLLVVSAQCLDNDCREHFSLGLVSWFKYGPRLGILLSSWWRGCSCTCQRMSLEPCQRVGVQYTASCSSASLVRIYFHGRMHRVCSLSGSSWINWGFIIVWNPHLLEVKLNQLGDALYVCHDLGFYPAVYLLLVQAINPQSASWAASIAKELVGAPAWILLYGLMIAILSFCFLPLWRSMGKKLPTRWWKLRVYWFRLSYEETRRYINRIVFSPNSFGTLYLILFTALPFLLCSGIEDFCVWPWFQGSFLMFVGDDVDHPRGSSSPSREPRLYKIVLGVVMYYFIPAWHGSERIWHSRWRLWYWTQATIEFDETIHQLRVFQGSGSGAKLVIPHYCPIALRPPSARFVRNRLSVDFLITFRGFPLIKMLPIQVEDLEWPAHKLYLYAFQIVAFCRGQEIASIDLGVDRNILSVRRVKDKETVYVQYLDDRGFYFQCYLLQRGTSLFSRLSNPPEGDWVLRELLTDASRMVLVNETFQKQFQTRNLSGHGRSGCRKIESQPRRPGSRVKIVWWLQPIRSIYHLSNKWD